MKHSAVVTALVAAVALTAAPVAAQSLSGSWELSSQGRGGTQTQMLTVTQEGMTLTGTISFSFGGRRGGGGGGGGESQTIEISDGTIDGNSFSFTMTLSFGGNSFDQVYSGTFEGDTIEGTIEGGRGGGRPFTGTRSG